MNIRVARYPPGTPVENSDVDGEIAEELRESSDAENDTDTEEQPASTIRKDDDGSRRKPLMASG